MSKVEKNCEKVYSPDITYITWIVLKGHKAILFFSPLSVVKFFGIFQKKKKVMT